MTPGPLPAWLWERLRCPAHGARLTPIGDTLVCGCGDRYPMAGGIPILLRSDVHQTRPHLVKTSLAFRIGDEPEAAGVRGVSAVDPYVQREVAGTGGYMYRPLVGRLTQYPIPAQRVEPQRPGDLLLDVGCNWGRWSVASARRGFRVVGIDPSIRGVLAAYRVARQLGIEAHFLVADARYLPFESGMFDVVFSYSVWQHFDKADAVLAMRSASDVVRPGGRVVVQMGNAYGGRSLFHLARRGFHRARGADVRYWRPSELLRTARTHIGPARLSVDGFFSLNPQPADRHLLPRRYRCLVAASETMRQVSGRLGWLVNVADSVYLESRRHPARAGA